MPPSAMMGLVATRAHHFERAELPAAGAKTGFELGDAHLAGPTPTLVASAPQFSRSITASGVATLPGNHEAIAAACA